MKKLPLLITLMLLRLTASAQIVDGRTNDVTVFHDYCPAIITLASGNINRQREANVFLKNGVLMYKQGKNIMEANMDQIVNACFGDRYFIKVNRQLMEVIDSVGSNLLVLLRLINMEGLNREIQNKSTITNIDMGDQLGVTRLEAEPDQLIYPVDDIYYFIIKGKPVLVHERDVKRAVGRKRLEVYERIVKSYGFRWSDKDCIMRMLKLLSQDN